MELERLRREREMELERIRAENEMKRQRIGEAGALARTAAEVQQRARQWLAETVGVDPIRGAVGEAGGVLRGGPTPSEAFRGDLFRTASAPIPTVSETASIPEIEQTIQALQGQQQLPVAPALGFARGGTIETNRGEDGVFRPIAPGVSAAMGTTKRAVLTGERNFDGDEEVVVLDTANPGRTEVIPLVSAAQTGGTYDVNTLKQALAPVYGSLGGFRDVPGTVRNDPRGYYQIWGGASGLGGLETARRLGYQPRLVADTRSGLGYWVDPSGAVRSIPYVPGRDIFKESGFRPQDVLFLDPNEIVQLGPQGAPLTEPPSLIEGPARPFSPRAMPLITPPEAGGLVLPDLPQLAGIWRFLGPQTQQDLASAYGVAGLGAGLSGNPIANALAQIERSVRAFTPHGTATRAAAGVLG
jgi:hypothetical protein